MIIIKQMIFAPFAVMKKLTCYMSGSVQINKFQFLRVQYSRIIFLGLAPNQKIECKPIHIGFGRKPSRTFFHALFEPDKATK